MATTIRMMFTNSNTIGAALIRAVTWSDFSHVVTLIDNDTIIHADFHGVRIEPIIELQNRSKSWMIVEYVCKDSDAVINAMKTQLGKPYDFSGVFGIILRDIDLQDDSKWWCSELPVYGFEVANDPKFATTFATRITPQHWLMLPHKIIDYSEGLTPCC